MEEPKASVSESDSRLRPIYLSQEGDAIIAMMKEAGDQLSVNTLMDLMDVSFRCGTCLKKWFVLDDRESLSAISIEQYNRHMSVQLVFRSETSVPLGNSMALSTDRPVPFSPRRSSATWMQCRAARP
jgi:hypothetical protein